MPKMRVRQRRRRRFTVRAKHAAIRRVPDRDAVSPPQLARDAPILNVLQPIKINLLKALWHNADLSIANGCQCFGCQRFDLNKPLRGDHWLDDLAAALTARHIQRVGLFLNCQTGCPHVSPYSLARLKAIEACILPALCGYACFAVQHGYDGQPVALPNGVVVGIMAGRNLERTSPKLTVHIIVRNHRHNTPQHWHQCAAADEALVALIVRVHCNCGVRQNCFGARGRNRNEVI